MYLIRESLVVALLHGIIPSMKHTCIFWLGLARAIFTSGSGVGP